MAKLNSLRRGVNTGQPVATSQTLRRYMRSDSDFSYGMRKAVEEIVEYGVGKVGRSFVVEIPEMSAIWDGETINIPPWAKFRFSGGVNLSCIGADKPVFWVRSDLDGYVPTGQYLEGQHQLGELFDTSNGVLVLRDGNLTSGGCPLRIGSGDGVMGPSYGGSTSSNLPYTILVGIGGIAFRGFDQSIQWTNYRNFCVHLHDVRGDGNRKGFTTSTAAGLDFGELTRCERIFLSNNYLSNVELNAAHQFSFDHSSLTTPQEGASHIVFNADHAHVLFSNGRFESGSAITLSSGDFPRSMLSLTNVDVIPTPKFGGAMVPHHLRKFFTGGRHLVRGSVVDFALSSNTPYISTYAGVENYLLADEAVDVQISVISTKQNPNSEFKNQAPIQNRGQFVRSPRNTIGTRGWVSRNASVSTAADAAASTVLGSNPLTTATGQANVFVTMNGHPYQTGDQVVVSGATDINGLLASDINGLRTVTSLNANSFFFAAAAGAANASTAGGGSAVAIGRPAIALSLSNQQGQAVSPMARVLGGRRYAGDMLLKLMASPAPTSPFVANLRMMWYGGSADHPVRGNPFDTTNGSNVVTLRWPGHGRVDGDSVTISGAADAGGIPAASINGVRAVTVVDDDRVTFVAGAAATATAAAGASNQGGTGVRVGVTNEFLGFSTLMPQGFVAGRTPSNYGVWMRHGGTGIIQAPAGAEWARLQLITNAGHTGELRIADSMAALAEC